MSVSIDRIDVLVVFTAGNPPSAAERIAQLTKAPRWLSQYPDCSSLLAVRENLEQ